MLSLLKKAITRQKTNQEPPICILGMHRSGTSCLAGCLEQAGVLLGDVHKWNPFNLKGNHEHPTIVDLNDAVLANSNGSWNKAPRMLQWNDALKKSRNNIIADFSTKRWGFKDPRTVLTLPFWLEAIPEMQFIGTFRHPLSVARSLANRDHTPIEEGLALWHTYNTKLLEHHKRFAFPIISFDLEPEHYKKTLASIFKEMELNDKSLWEDNAFFDNELRHNNNVILQNLPKDILTTYELLQSHAVTLP